MLGSRDLHVSQGCPSGIPHACLLECCPQSTQMRNGARPHCSACTEHAAAVVGASAVDTHAQRERRPDEACDACTSALGAHAQNCMKPALSRTHLPFVHSTDRNGYGRASGEMCCSTGQDCHSSRGRAHTSRQTFPCERRRRLPRTRLCQNQACHDPGGLASGNMPQSRAGGTVVSPALAC